MNTQKATEAPLGTPAALTSRDEIRIYVACLAAYNNGHLHGRWIDATQGVDHIWEQTRAMLAASPIEDAEEWAIHDYEGFGAGAIGEYSGFDTVCELADFMEERGDLARALIEHFCGAVDEARAALEEYAGEYDSLAEFAQQLHGETGTEIPAGLENYIDWQAMGRDLELNGDVFTIALGFTQVHVFWNR